MSTISTSGISPSMIIRSEHLLRIINALNGVSLTDIVITGSLNVSGSVSQGYNIISSGSYSHAEGIESQTIGDYSHAEGNNTRAFGTGSHTEGINTISSGSWSHAEGSNTVAIGEASHAEGFNTIALGDYSHVQGQFNLPSSTQFSFIVGNGASNVNRSNLIFAAGNEVQITGSLSIKDILLLAPRTTTPTPQEGMIISSGSVGASKLYYYNGTTWNALF